MSLGAFSTAPSQIKARNFPGWTPDESVPIVAASTTNDARAASRMNATMTTTAQAPSASGIHPIALGHHGLPTPFERAFRRARQIFRPYGDGRNPVFTLDHYARPAEPTWWGWRLVMRRADGARVELFRREEAGPFPADLPAAVRIAIDHATKPDADAVAAFTPAQLDFVIHHASELRLDAMARYAEPAPLGASEDALVARIRSTLPPAPTPAAPADVAPRLLWGSSGAAYLLHYSDSLWTVYRAAPGGMLEEVGPLPDELTADQAAEVLRGMLTRAGDGPKVLLPAAWMPRTKAPSARAGGRNG